MKYFWQIFVSKLAIGVVALSLAFFASCSDNSSLSADSNEQNELNLSSHEEVDESSSSKNDLSSNTPKSDSLSNLKTSSSSSFNAFSSSSKKNTKKPTVIEKSCAVVEHSGTEKSLTTTSENTIATSGITFHNEFSKKNAGTATYYTDGSFKLDFNDATAGALVRSQKTVLGSKMYSELGNISIEYTAAITGTATLSYVGASAFASSDDDMTIISVYVIENYLEDSEVLMGGSKVGEFDHGDGKYDIHTYLEQVMKTNGVQKNYSYFVVRESPRLCGYLDMTAIFDEIVNVGAPELPLRWLSVSAEIQEGGLATIDMQEVKIHLDQKSNGSIDSSNTSDDFCKVEHNHSGTSTAIPIGSQVELNVHGTEYIFESFASSEGFLMEYFNDGTFSMECPGIDEMDCEGLVFREFKTPILYKDVERIQVEYSFSKEGSGGVSIIGAHGKMETYDSKNKLEFYVLEDWLESYAVDMNLGDKKGTINVDGSSYEVYFSCNTATENKSCKVYSIRKDKRRCGTVNVSAQISQWESLNIEIYPLKNVGLTGFMVSGAEGKVDFNYTNIKVVE